MGSNQEPETIAAMASASHCIAAAQSTCTHSAAQTYFYTAPTHVLHNRIRPVRTTHTKYISHAKKIYGALLRTQR
jgi:hypothetical protein